MKNHFLKEAGCLKNINNDKKFWLNNDNNNKDNYTIIHHHRKEKCFKNENDKKYKSIKYGNK